MAILWGFWVRFVEILGAIWGDFRRDRVAIFTFITTSVKMMVNLTNHFWSRH